jgi:hypothetical protein
MSSQRLTPDEVQKAQELVSRVRGISSCRISTDGEGEVSEVHVVASGNKPAKLIARDVESVLKAEMGVDIDYRKIGVVNIDPGPDTDETAPAAAPGARQPQAAGAGIEEFPVEEFPSRFAFQSVNVFTTREGLKAEVELTRDSFESFGSCNTERTTEPPWRVIAEATLRAVSEFLDEETRLCLVEVLKVAVRDKFAFVVSVDVVDGRGTKSLAGCSIVSENENQTVVYATLDAVNRLIGKLEFKSYIEYKIR